MSKRFRYTNKSSLMSLIPNKGLKWLTEEISQTKGGRRCTICNAVLSIHNDGKICQCHIYDMVLAGKDISKLDGRRRR